MKNEIQAQRAKLAETLERVRDKKAANDALEKSLLHRTVDEALVELNNGLKEMGLDNLKAQSFRFRD